MQASASPLIQGVSNSKIVFITVERMGRGRIFWLLDYFYRCFRCLVPWVSCSVSLLRFLVPHNFCMVFSSVSLLIYLDAVIIRLIVNILYIVRKIK